MTIASAPLLSFDIWDVTGNCPHCGSDDTEVYLDEEVYHCCECGLFSASFLSDGMEDETGLINALDRWVGYGDDF